MNKNRQKTQNTQIDTLLIGLLAGGLVGAGTALLLAPKKGSDVRKDLYNAYDDLSETASDKREEIMDTISDWHNPRSLGSNKTLIIGGLAAGILGAATAYLLTQKTKKNFSETFFEKTHEIADNIKHAVPEDFAVSAGGWIRQAKTILNTVDSVLNSGETAVRKAARAHAPSEPLEIKDFVEFANLGVRLFNNLKGR